MAAGSNEKDDEYVCELDSSTVKKAKLELNEDAKDRLGSVKALRAWVDQQPHITFNGDTRFLMYFLRTAKFSQLRARTLVENYTKSVTNFPNWFRNIDTHDPALAEIVEQGYTIPLAKKTKNGATIFLYRFAMTKKNGEMFSVNDEIRAGSIAATWANRDENVQVNGYEFVVDMTGSTLKQMTRWTMDDMRKWNSCWQNAMPGRFKGFHYYNAGSLLDGIMTVFRPLLSKKMQERIHFHDTVESLYKYIGMEVLPNEYLPDDYQGPSAGPMQQIIDTFQKDVMEESFRQRLLHHSSEQTFNLDETKRPAYKPSNESFRKLAVD